MSYIHEVPLSNICRPKQWKVIPASKHLDAGYPLYGANGKIGFYSEYTHENSTLMITCRGATCGNVHISEPKSYINGNAMALDDLDDELVDINYLYRFFQSRGFDDVISGTAQPQITRTGLEKITVPLPPLEEQKRIAAILDKADTLRRKRQKAIDLTDQLLRSVFLDIFVDPSAKGWNTSTVEKLADNKKGSIRTGPFGSQLLHSEFTESGIAVLGIDNAVKNIFRWAKPRFISKEKYEQLKRFTVRPGDLLITIMGTCGRSAIVPEDCPVAINTKHLCCITLDKGICTSEFLHSYFLMHPTSRKYLARAAKGAVMDGLNMGIIKDLPVCIPPIELQKKYSEIYKKLHVNKEALKLSAEVTNTLTNSLSQQAFRGELTKQTKAA